MTTTPVYDYRGRVTQQGGDSFVYDQADRHISTSGAGAATVTYTRDASGAIVARSENATTVRYSGNTVLSTANTALERSVPLPGGVIVTKLAAGDVWDCHPIVQQSLGRTARGATRGPISGAGSGAGSGALVGCIIGAVAVGTGAFVVTAGALAGGGVVAGCLTAGAAGGGFGAMVGALIGLGAGAASGARGQNGGWLP